MKRKSIIYFLAIFILVPSEATTIKISPVYPKLAIEKCIEGWVIVEFSIAPDGTTYDHKVINSYPENIFEGGALQAAKRLNYQGFPNALGKHTKGVNFKFSYNFDSSQPEFAHCQKNITSASRMLRPFGPPRDAQRYAHFVRVATLPVSHKMCIALVAPVADVRFMVLGMEPVEFLKILDNGGEREISDLSYKLLHITDMATLKKLSVLVNHVEIFLKNLASSEKGKIESVTRIISFLKPISNGGCRCEKYNICSYPVHSEHKKGLVNILSEMSNKETFETQCTCECVLCQKAFEVFECEAGFGRRAEWKSKI